MKDECGMMKKKAESKKLITPLLEKFMKPINFILTTAFLLLLSQPMDGFGFSRTVSCRIDKL